jgi:hypothetical protein
LRLALKNVENANEANEHLLNINSRRLLRLNAQKVNWIKPLYAPH